MTPINAPAPPLEITNDDRMMAAVSHGLTFFEGGILGPLVLYLIKKNESEFVAFHALQSVYFGLAFLAISVLTCGVGAIVLGIPYMVFEVIATLRAYEGEWYELPVVGRYARERHPGGAASGLLPTTF